MNTKFRIFLLSAAAFCALMLMSIPASADNRSGRTVSFDFVNDQDFPISSDDRESEPSFIFSKSRIILKITAIDQFGIPVDVSRRGPGGLGVVGNGDRDEPDGGTTSGNRINAGESLLIEVLDRNNRPKKVKLVSITLSRIVRDLENFPEAPEPKLNVTVDDGQVSLDGILDPELDEERIIFRHSGLSVVGDTFTLSNGTPFDEIANRYRISGMTVRRIPRY